MHSIRQKSGPVFAALLFLASAAAAHRPLVTNLDLATQLKPDRFVIYVTTATFHCPPLFDVEPGTPHPAVEQCKAPVEAYFRSTCPVTIDGIRVAPILEAVRFNDVQRGIHLGAERSFVMADVKLVYPLKTAPRRIAVRWGLFVGEPAMGWGDLVDADQTPEEIVAPLYIGDEIDYFYFSETEPEFIWHAAIADGAVALATVVHRPLPVPAAPLAIAGVLVLFGLAHCRLRFSPPVVLLVLCLSLGTAAATWRAAQWDAATLARLWRGLPEDPALLATFRSLHANIYRAFDYDDEEQIYEALAASVDGPLLRELYGQIYESLILRDQGGAVARVQRVEIETARVTARGPAADGSGPAASVYCEWRVDGFVQHWGHTHRRVNAYAADYVLAPRGDTWKITGVTVSRQDRVAPPRSSPLESDQRVE